MAPDAAAALLDEFLEWSPFRLDVPSNQRLIFFLLFHADLKEGSEYRQQVDDTYRMTHS